MQVVVVVAGMMLMMLAGELLSLLRLACGMGHVPLLRRQLGAPTLARHSFFPEATNGLQARAILA